MQPASSTLIITGAAGNLGTVVTRYFLQKGFRVIAFIAPGTPPPPFAEACTVLQVNLNDAAATHACVAQAIAVYGSIEGALLLAGGFAMGNLAATGTDAIQQQIALNFDTAYHVAQPLLAHFRERGLGQLVFVGARPALEAQAGKDLLAYALSKSLLFQLADCINAEHKGTPITASVIVPSTIDTPANRAAMPDADFSKWVTAAAIAETLFFLFSEAGYTLRQSVLKLYNNA